MSAHTCPPHRAPWQPLWETVAALPSLPRPPPHTWQVTHGLAEELGRGGGPRPPAVRTARSLSPAGRLHLPCLLSYTWEASVLTESSIPSPHGVAVPPEKNC